MTIWTTVDRSTIDFLHHLETTIEEWQQARAAIFAHKMESNATPEQLALWKRLGDAEDALMKIKTR
jgi:hypothetical protein